MTLARKHLPLIALFVAACIGLGLSFLVVTIRAAQGPAVIDAPRLRVFTAIPLYGKDGALLQLSVSFTYEVPMVLPDGKEIRMHLKTETTDFVLQKEQLVPIGGELVEFGDLGTDIEAAADFVWFLHNPRQLSPDRPKLERRKKAKVATEDERRALRS